MGARSTPAAIWAITVRAPWPNSVVPDRTVTDPSGPIRTVAIDTGWAPAASRPTDTPRPRRLVGRAGASGLAGRGAPGAGGPRVPKRDAVRISHQSGWPRPAEDRSCLLTVLLWPGRPWRHSSD